MNIKQNNDTCTVLVTIAVSILFTLFIFYLIINKSENFSNSVINLMDDVPDIPSIKMIENNPKRTIFQRIMGIRPKIPFNINETYDGDYTINVPNYDDFSFTGKGLVIAAAGNRYRYLTGLYANLYAIRKYHKSTIPIEIFYVGKSEEFNYDIKKLILSLGNITIYNLLDRIDTKSDESDLRGYQTKPLSILCSSFEEVILLDADALCFIDPKYLFLAEGYKHSGMLLFKDYVDCMSFISKDFIETIGIGVDLYCDYTGDFEIDSSCVVMNKKMCWDTLYAICIVNVKSDSYHKSKNVLGDKDTFIICSMLIGEINPYISEPAPCVLITENEKVIVGHLQSTKFENNEIFTHYNNQKIDLANSEVDNYTYVEMKNPKSGEECDYGLPLTDKIKDTFKYAREAMKEIDGYIPHSLKKNVEFINGVSKGLIN